MQPADLFLIMQPADLFLIHLRGDGVLAITRQASDAMA
jgi:hypothetical protein